MKTTWTAYAVFNFVTKKYQPQYKGDKGKLYTSKEAAEEWASQSVHWEVHTFEVRRVPNE